MKKTVKIFKKAKHEFGKVVRKGVGILTFREPRHVIREAKHALKEMNRAAKEMSTAMVAATSAAAKVEATATVAERMVSSSIITAHSIKVNTQYIGAIFAALTLMYIYRRHLRPKDETHVGKCGFFSKKLSCVVNEITPYATVGVLAVLSCYLWKNPQKFCEVRDVFLRIMSLVYKHGISFKDYLLVEFCKNTRLRC